MQFGARIRETKGAGELRGGVHGAPPWEALTRPATGHCLALERLRPSDGDQMATKRRYPFGVNYVKEPLVFFSFEPAVQNALSDFTLSKLRKRSLCRVKKNTFSDNYEFATRLNLLIKYSFELRFCPFKFC